LRIAFDSWTLATRFRHQGIYVYARNLVEKFKWLAGEDPGLEFCIFAPLNSNDHSSNDANAIEPGRRFELTRTGLLARDRRWRLYGASLEAARSHADLVFSPTAAIVPLGVMPLICTIHDASPIFTPSHSRRVTLLLRSLLWWSAKFSRGIITDSESSKKDLVELYGLPESKVSAVYLGYDKQVFNESAMSPTEHEALLARLGITKPYILHHGTIQPRKNLGRLIAAYRMLLSRNKSFDLELVLAGNRGWQCDEIMATASGSRDGRVVFPGVLSDPGLASLIKGASLVVIPSLYEGFCLPMVESMACGTPTVAARASCLPEVSGGVLRYFDPHSVDDMANCMQQALEDTALREELARRGKERAAVFDWERCARETIQALKKHMQNGRN
jgi:glycosyltransferase involved in cell wall biosynthesis